MVVNIALNLLLIPRFGAVGASFAALFGNIGLSFISLFFITKFQKIDFNFFNRLFVQLLLTILVMFGVTFYIDKYFGFIIAFFAGSLAYLLMLFVTKTITKKQILEMMSLTSK